MNQMLFVDSCGYASMDIMESAGGICRFRGKFQEANAVNKNKRRYSYDSLFENVERLQETVKMRGLYGELDHPTDSIVHLSNASHLVTKLWFDGNILMGEGEILNTPSGKVLKAILEQNGKVGISSRGVGQGDMSNEGVLEIGKNFKLITFDTVCDPSTANAFQSRITGKNEHLEIPKPVIAEAKIINTKSLVSYFGCLLESKLQECKNKVKTK